MNGDDASMPTDIESDATAELKRAKHELQRCDDTEGDDTVGFVTNV